MRVAGIQTIEDANDFLPRYLERHNTLFAVEAAEETADFSGEELSILVSAGWMDNRYDATIERFEDTYGVTVDLQTIPADQYSDLLQSKYQLLFQMKVLDFYKGKPISL